MSMGPTPTIGWVDAGNTVGEKSGRDTVCGSTWKKQKITTTKFFDQLTFLETVITFWLIHKLRVQTNFFAIWTCRFQKLLNPNPPETVYSAKLVILTLFPVLLSNWKLFYNNLLLVYFVTKFCLYFWNLREILYLLIPMKFRLWTYQFWPLYVYYSPFLMN
jgi:hypothetical protein